MKTDARTECWEIVTVCDIPMLFSCLRIDRETVPEGLYLYEVRHADEDWGDPVQIARWVMVNHFGTLLSKAELPLEENTLGNNAYIDIDPEEDWNYEGVSCTIEEFMCGEGINDGN